MICKIKKPIYWKFFGNLFIYCIKDYGVLPIFFSFYFYHDYNDYDLKLWIWWLCLYISYKISKQDSQFNQILFCFISFYYYKYYSSYLLVCTYVVIITFIITYMNKKIIFWIYSLNMYVILSSLGLLLNFIIFYISLKEFTINRSN